MLRNNRNNKIRESYRWIELNKVLIEDDGKVNILEMNRYYSMIEKTGERKQFFR